MIRPATHADVPRLVELGTRFMREGSYWGRRRAVTAEVFAAHLSAMIEHPKAGFFVAEERDGDLAGAICVVMMPDIFSGEDTGLKLHWIVEPKAAGIGLRLERRARRWAKENGASGLFMSAVNRAAARLLERLGYERMEIVYYKGL